MYRLGLALLLLTAPLSGCGGGPEPAAVNQTVAFGDAQVTLPNWPYRALPDASRVRDREAAMTLALPGGPLESLERWAPVVSGQVPGGYIVVLAAADRREDDDLFVLVRPDYVPATEPSKGWQLVASRDIDQAKDYSALAFTVAWPTAPGGPAVPVSVVVGAPAVDTAQIFGARSDATAFTRAVPASNGVAVAVLEPGAGMQRARVGVAGTFLDAFEPLGTAGFTGSDARQAPAATPPSASPTS